MSREYRAVIKASVGDLQQLMSKNYILSFSQILFIYRYISWTCSVDEACGEKEKSDLAAKLELWDIIELVWNLCELLYIDTAPGLKAELKEFKHSWMNTVNF